MFVASTEFELKPMIESISCRVHLLELLVGAYLLFCGIYDIIYGKNTLYVYLLFQSVAFFIVGFGFVGKYVPASS